MMKPTLSLVVLGLACLACVTAAGAPAAEEMVDNPAYKSWAKLKPGSTVTMGVNTKMPAMEMKSELIYKLVSVDKDKVVVEFKAKVDLPGAPDQPAQKQNIAAKVKKSEASPGKPGEGFKGSVKEKGSETIEIAGKKYKCKVYEYDGEAEGNKTTGKTWSSEEIPNLTAKAESTVTLGDQSMKSTIAVTKIEAK